MKAALREHLAFGLRTLLGLNAVFSLGLLAFALGWTHPEEQLRLLENLARCALAVFGTGQLAAWGLEDASGWRRLSRYVGVVLAVVALVESVEFSRIVTMIHAAFPTVSVKAGILTVVALSQIPVFLHAAVRFVRLHEFFAIRRISPGLVLMLTFALLILCGFGLLSMPLATREPVALLDRVFTATSAVCVTGLVTVDTETAFTPLGHGILLVLIQLGGLGVMTLTTFLAHLFGGVSLRGRVLLQDLISEENIGRISATLPRIVWFTFASEAAGAACLYWAVGDVPDDRGGPFFAAVFHSVSAFCNAGFSIWSAGLYDPLVRANAPVQGIVMALIVAGGIGFPVLIVTAQWLATLRRRRARRARLTVHARLAWLTTAVLIAAGALAVGLAEYGVAGHPHDTPVWIASLFHSITARTAGFNISPVEAMTPAAVSVMMLLMFVGGSPGSTAGGIKTTAFAVALLNVRRILLGRRDVEVFTRRLPDETVARALAVLFLSIAWVGLASTLLALFERETPLSDLVFETVSALATVGLSRGVTPGLSDGGKVVIIVTMFAGRVGLLYFISAFLRRRPAAAYRLPDENVYVA